MKHMRLAICVAVFALVGGIAMSEDLDVRALQAKLAAQEARLNDMQAKMAYNNNASSGSVADGVLSIKKNAVVTIGGNVNTRYFARSGKITTLNGRTLPNFGIGVNQGSNTIARTKIGDFRVSDAQLFVKIDVNDYFDAYAAFEMQDEAAGNNAKQYWVRWKNLCNSGFGVLVGRSDLVFGDNNGTGVITGWVGGGDGALHDTFDVAGGSFLGYHGGWDHARTTQLTPYWESQDGKFKAEVSFIQGIDERYYGDNRYTGFDGNKYRSHNYGIGSFSARLTANPIEGLKLSASFMNLYNNNKNAVNWDPNRNYNAVTGVFDGGWGDPAGATSSSNQAIALAFRYTPACFNRLTVWSQWVHGWNEGFIKDRDSDTVNFGGSFALTDSMSFFAQGDYIRLKHDLGNDNDAKTTGWAFYTGLQYRLPYGVDMELGWRHEKINAKFNGVKWAKVKTDTIYGHLGFNF